MSHLSLPKDPLTRKAVDDLEPVLGAAGLEIVRSVLPVPFRLAGNAALSSRRAGDAGGGAPGRCQCPRCSLTFHASPT